MLKCQYFIQLRGLQRVWKYTFNIEDSNHVMQIFVNILTDNTSSIALFSKFGFELVGVKKQWIRVNHQFKDEALYQLIQQDL